MKKICNAIIYALILLYISGCALPINNTAEFTTSAIQNTENNATTYPTDTTAETEQESTQEIRQAPMVSISVPATTETQTAEDGTVIFSYTYQNISLIVPDPEVADKIIVDFLSRMDEADAQAEIIRSAAKEDYSSGNLHTPYLCHSIYEPARIDHSVLSLFGRYVGYSGSAHPETLFQSANYDLITGEVLTLSHIITPETTTDTLSNLIIDALNAQKNTQFYEGYETTITERFSGGISSEKSWYFSPEGLCFYFSPYEIAPYASGVIIAQIPYNELTGILDDSYFPAEKEKATGVLLVDRYDTDSLESYTQFSELILEESGEKLLISTDKSVYNIRINVNYKEDGSPAYTAFAAYSLTPGDAIATQTSSEMKNLLSISYYANDSEHEHHINP